MNRLDKIEARANAATEGPWEWEGEAKAEWEEGANSLVPSRRPDDPVLYGYGYDASGIEVKTPADAEFIAHARTDVPALVAALRAVLVDGLGLKPRFAFGPVRVGITGSRVSPPLFESIELLGRESSLTRLRALRSSL